MCTKIDLSDKEPFFDFANEWRRWAQYWGQIILVVENVSRRPTVVIMSASIWMRGPNVVGSISSNGLRRKERLAGFG